MSQKSANVFLRVRVLAVQFTVIAGIFAVGLVRAQTTWTVTVDVTSGQIQYKYSQVGTVTKCNQGNNTPTELHVCPKDVIKWNGATPSNKYHLVVYFPDLTPFTDQGTHGIHGYHGDESKKSLGGDTAEFDSLASPDHHKEPAQYEYSVVLTDTKSGQVYPADPKIVVGSGIGQFQSSVQGADAFIAQAQQLLKNALEQVPTLRPDEQQQAREALDADITNLTTILNGLQSLGKLSAVQKESAPKQGL